jgi:hypothetical protein
MLTIAIPIIITFSIDENKLIFIKKLSTENKKIVIIIVWKPIGRESDAQEQKPV